MQDDSADELHVEMAHVESAASCFAHESEGGNHGGLDCCLELIFVIFGGGVGVFEALGDLGFEGRGARGKIRVGERLYFGLEGVDCRDGWRDPLDVALVLRADEARHDAVNYLFNVHSACWMPRAAH